MSIANWFPTCDSASLVGTALSGYALYYLFNVVKHPKLVCQDGSFKQFLLEELPVIKDKFWPSFWCVEARLQTLLASLVRSAILPNPAYEREILSLKDGGQVTLDWLEADDDAPRDSDDDGETSATPTVIILPGLTGSSGAEYIRGLVLAGQKCGIRTVVFTQRGIGEIPLTTPRTFCAMSHEDLEEVVAHVRNKCPGSPIGATGISMGGLILGNYIVAKQNETNLDSAMIISVPWNVFRGSESIETPFLNLMLNWHLASSLCSIVRKWKDTIAQTDLYCLDDIFKSKTIREFDATYTVKQFGFKDVHDYYSRASLHDKVSQFKLPTLCLSAADDPMQPYDGIPIAAIETTPNVAVLIPSRGGHIGFMEGALPFNVSNQYMFKIFTQYFQAMLKRGGYKKFERSLTCR